jgi:Raf kinase inhibitor-like YbhB/YbcL family protein
MMSRHQGVALAAMLVLAAFSFPGCRQQTTGGTEPEAATAPGWSLTSNAFAEGEAIPAKYTCDGENISPALSWSKVPEGAKELALICDDPDAPRGTFTHWLIYGMSPELPSLPEAMPPLENPPAVGGSRQGTNDTGKIGYFGPCPPKGKSHHYHFRLYALDAATDLKPGAKKDELLHAMEGHILAKTELVGLYRRQ